MLSIFIVSLKSDLIRRNTIASFLTNNGLDFNFIDAVYGKDLKDPELSLLPINTAESRLKRKLTPGEVGCTLSHLKVYSQLASSDHDWVCILEDDALLTSEFVNFVKSFDKDKHKLLPDNLYLLGGQEGIFQSKYIAQSRFTKLEVGDSFFHKTVGSHDHIFRTCCYLMSKDMANNILSLSKRKFFVSDDWAYFIQLGIIKEIYLTSIVSHPIDLSGSHLEAERLLSFDSSTSVKQTYVTKIKWHLSHRIKLIMKYLKTFSP